MLLVVVIGEWKSNLSDELILEPITINHLKFVVKMSENIIDVSLLFLK